MRLCKPISFMKKFYSLLLFSLLTFSLFSQITISVGTTSYSINPSLLGLNGRSTEGPSWTDATFLSMVADMNPAYVRYPAGTQGNQWNWSTGTFIASLGMNAKEIFYIPMFVNGLPQGAKIIYLVNMVLPTPQTGITFTTTTDAVLSTDATLTAKITDILNALKAFESAGHLPEVCEIGNELYFANSTEAGVYAGNATFYLQHARAITLAIKNKYPAMKIILCTTKGGTTSRAVWNNTVFNALSTDNQLRAAVYGVVQHHYINDTYGYAGTVTDLTTAKTIIDEGITYVQDVVADYSVVPSSMKLWITEYGATKVSADGMWAAGMRTATMTLSFMLMGVKVDNLLWHHITDDPNILNSTKTKAGPSGMAFMMLAKAMNGCNTYKKLVFSNMSATNVYAGLTGYKFIADGVENIFILNTENTTYSNVNLNGLFGSGTLQFAKQYWSQTPYVADVTPTTNISVNTSTVLNSYQINPFSMTVISKKLNTENTQIASENTVKVYPTLVDNYFTIESNQDYSYTVQDLLGRNLGCGLLTTGINIIDATTFSKGINFIVFDNRVIRLIKK